MNSIKNRFLIKIPGSAFSLTNSDRIEKESLEWIAKEIANVKEAGFQPVVLVGSSNLWKGNSTSPINSTLTRVTADQMGMLGTLLNALALKEALEHLGQIVRVYTALRCDQVAAPYIRGKVLSSITKEHIPILAGGTGNPFFSADSSAALRARELKCEAVIRATPASDLSEFIDKFGSSIGFQDALTSNLIDSMALSFLKEENMEARLIASGEKGSLMKAITNQQPFTIR